MIVERAERNIDKFWTAYENFRLNFYKNVTRDADGKRKITILEAMTLEVINALDRPIVNDVAKFLEISQPNAAYKVGTLEDKGYINKVQSTEDRREYFLVLTDKYDDYVDGKKGSVNKVFRNLSDNYSDDEWEIVEKILDELVEHQQPMIKEIM